MSILICAATNAEAKAIRKAIRKTDQIHKVQVLKVGIGATSAAQALEREFKIRSRQPELVVSSGFAGSLSDTYSVGTWVYGENLSASNQARALFTSPPDEWIEALKAVGATIRDADSVVTATKEESETIVDMESNALAKVCEKYGVPFCVMRMVSDTPSKPLPPFIASWVEVSKGANPVRKIGRLLTAVTKTVSRPAQVARLIKDGRRWQRNLQKGWQKISRTSLLLLFFIFICNSDASSANPVPKPPLAEQRATTPLRAANTFGLYVAGAEPYPSFVSINGAYNILDDLRVALGAGTVIFGSSYGVNARYLFMPQSSLTPLFGIGAVRTRIDDLSGAFGLKAEADRVMWSSSWIAGVDWQSSAGLNLGLGLSWMWLASPKDTIGTKVFPYVDIGWFF